MISQRHRRNYYSSRKHHAHKTRSYPYNQPNKKSFRFNDKNRCNTSRQHQTKLENNNPFLQIDVTDTLKEIQEYEEKNKNTKISVEINIKQMSKQKNNKKKKNLTKNTNINHGKKKETNTESLNKIKPDYTLKKETDGGPCVKSPKPIKKKKKTKGRKIKNTISTSPGTWTADDHYKFGLLMNAQNKSTLIPIFKPVYNVKEINCRNQETNCMQWTKDVSLNLLQITLAESQKLLNEFTSIKSKSTAESLTKCKNIYLKYQIECAKAVIFTQYITDIIVAEHEKQLQKQNREVVTKFHLETIKEN